MLISTWDGDEFHFLSYYQSFLHVQSNIDTYKKVRQDFHTKLLKTLSQYELDEIKIEQGIGHFKGSIPASLSKMFIQNEGSFIVCPSFDAMKEFLKS